MNLKLPVINEEVLQKHKILMFRYFLVVTRYIRVFSTGVKSRDPCFILIIVGDLGIR